MQEYMDEENCDQRARIFTRNLLEKVWTAIEVDLELRGQGKRGASWQKVSEINTCSWWLEAGTTVRIAELN